MAFLKFPKRNLRKLIQRGEYEQAINLGNELEPKLGKDADFLFIMGSIYYTVEDAQKALHYFNRALKIKPGDIDTLHLKANIHAHLKERDAALTCCRQILEQDPDHREARLLADALDGDRK